MSNLTIKDIDYGGGDDGSGSSLFKASNALIHPPSMGKIFPKKKFEK